MQLSTPILDRIAAPILGADGNAQATLGIAGAMPRLDAKAEAWYCDLVREGAQDIASQL